MDVESLIKLNWKKLSSLPHQALSFFPFIYTSVYNPLELSIGHNESFCSFRGAF
jgi:hypothetical protein